MYSKFARTWALVHSLCDTIEQLVAEVSGPETQLALITALEAVRSSKRADWAKTTLPTIDVASNASERVAKAQG